MVVHGPQVPRANVRRLEESPDLGRDLDGCHWCEVEKG